MKKISYKGYPFPPEIIQQAICGKLQSASCQRAISMNGCGNGGDIEFPAVIKTDLHTVKVAFAQT
jgi:hypothetical protein